MKPYKQSPLHHVLQELEPRWIEIDDWSVPAGFAPVEEEVRKLSTAVGLCDLSFELKTELRGRELDRLLTLPEIGRLSVGPEGCVYRITQQQVLLIGSAPDLGVNGCVHATDRTSGFVQFLLAGPCGTDVLSRLASFDLREPAFPDRSCRCAPIAHVNAIIARRDRKQVRAYEILVSREYGEYVWRTIWDAGHPFGMIAFGIDAKQALEA